jgi:nitrogen fixation NifU-like protein
MDHFMNPRNVGEIENADGVGEVGNPVCGDMMTFYAGGGQKDHSPDSGR